MASVVSLFVSAAIGQPMQPRTSVQALAGRGLEGDRYSLGQGSYSNLKRPAARHVSLIAREAMQASNEELVRQGLTPFEPIETRRNIIVEGIDVYTLLGHDFQIGAVRLRGSEPTLPCNIPSAVAGKTGFREAYHDRGGIRAEVLSDGIISIGDFIQADWLASK
jgi:MOSC domain-containing protein YiiM